MSQSTRLRNIIAILEARHRPVPIQVFLDEMEISLSTFKRDIAVLRDLNQAPIIWKSGEDGNGRGYVLEDKEWSSGKLGLPRAWFTATEIYALLMIDELARHISPGLLTEHLQPLITRITLALSSAEDSPDNIRSRIKILASASKRRHSNHFETVAQAAVKQKRLEISYFTRSRNESTIRAISPIRLVHYKENWYLIAWCHKVEGLRMFALDAIESAYIKNDDAVNVDPNEVDEIIGRDFGIYSGGERKWAKLKFTPLQARWVKDEVWHIDQKNTLLDDGCLLLEIPYADAKEISLEILKFGSDVEVMEPLELRQSITEKLRLALAQYRN